VLALLFAAALSGCSIAKLTYNYSDLLLLGKIDAYLDPSPEQKSATLGLLRRRLEAHRRHGLPSYLDYLRRTRALVADGLSKREAAWIVA
jgi:hypothetical protein